MSGFMQFFDAHMLPKLGVRAPTFRAVLSEALHQKATTIVETGSMRKEDNWAGDGQSTLIWDAYRRFQLGTFTSIDVDPQACTMTRLACPQANVIEGDSIEALSRYTGLIDILYLDSFDVDMANDHPAALHCLFEFCTALPHLHSSSIVFVDDSPTSTDVVQGKGHYVADYMKCRGVTPFTFGYQIAWLMP